MLAMLQFKVGFAIGYGWLANAISSSSSSSRPQHAISRRKQDSPPIEWSVASEAVYDPVEGTEIFTIIHSSNDKKSFRTRYSSMFAFHNKIYELFDFAPIEALDPPAPFPPQDWSLHHLLSFGGITLLQQDRSERATMMNAWLARVQDFGLLDRHDRDNSCYIHAWSQVQNNKIPSGITPAQEDSDNRAIGDIKPPTRQPSADEIMLENYVANRRGNLMVGAGRHGRVPDDMLTPQFLAKMNKNKRKWWTHTT